ncbi:hypothetical protein BHE74_00027748 [Ensete ventricosum]|nr:hypothetical protein GW17_00048754 [Ensete ventricosum]RWW64969.1 hypothetical protein BHE74_00027748 [Ensete ventricosum]
MVVARDAPPGSASCVSTVVASATNSRDHLKTGCRELVSRANAFICFWVGCFVHPGSWPSHTAEHRLYRFLFRSFHIFPSGNSRVPSPVYCGELHRS